MSQTIQKTETIQISRDGIYRGLTVHTPYPLEADEFLKLTKVNNLLPIWAHTFFTGTSLFLITFLAKVLDNKYLSGTNKYLSGTNTITNVELITLGVLVALAIIFEILYFCAPSAKKNTLKVIEKHFEDNKPKPAGFGNEYS